MLVKNNFIKKHTTKSLNVQDLQETAVINDEFTILLYNKVKDNQVFFVHNHDYIITLICGVWVYMLNYEVKTKKKL